MTKLDILMLFLLFCLILLIGSIIFEKPKEKIEETIEENSEIEMPLLPYEENYKSQVGMSGVRNFDR